VQPSYSPPAQPAYSPPAQTSIPPQSAPSYARTTSTDARQSDIDHYLRSLADPDERVRYESAIQLGRLRATRAIDPLAATLSGDASAVVREAAARGLGLIGEGRGLPALQRAAQVDTDHDVRRTAQFSMEIIQSR
jgi:HEAT repeat protein